MSRGVEQRTFSWDAENENENENEEYERSMSQ